MIDTSLVITLKLKVSFQKASEHFIYFQNKFRVTYSVFFYKKKSLLISLQLYQKPIMLIDD